MFSLLKDEFIEEIKAEMAGYEELTQEHINDWVQHFEKYVSQDKVKNDKLKRKGNTIEIVLKDESELFGIVDKYLVAVEGEELASYWEDWKL